MLKALRENFKHLQWILWAVIAVFVIFVFVDWGMGSQRGGAGDAALAAKAGDIRITTAEFQREYAFAEDRYRQAYGKNFSPELARAMNLPEQVLNSLIDRRLFREEAERLHLKVTDDELTQHILGIKDPQSGRALFVKDGVFVGDAAYRRILAANHLVPAELRGAAARADPPREAEPVLHGGRRRVRRRGEGRVRETERQGEDRLGAPARRLGRAGARLRRGGRGVLQDEPDAVHAAREAQGEVPPRRDGEDQADDPGVGRRRRGRLHRERGDLPQGRGSARAAHPVQGRGGERRRAEGEGGGRGAKAQGPARTSRRSRRPNRTTPARRRTAATSARFRGAAW